MSKSLIGLAVFGLILLVVGLVEFVYGIFAAQGVNLVFGAILSLVGSTMFRMSATRMKKQKEQTENSPYYCMECGLQTNTRSDILTHANTTGHNFTPGTKQPANASSTDSTDILKTRYAKGEITKEQFEQMKKDLDIK